MKLKDQETCETCYKIKCPQCGWEPDDHQLALIQAEILTRCPKCNWNPSTNLKPQK